MKFLEQLAEQIVKLGFSSLHDTVVILPNKRARRMLLEQIAKRLDKPAFAPDIFAINDFVEKLSPLEKMDPFKLLTLLFSQYRADNEDNPDSFNDFLYWGPTFMDDISEIDMQMADATAVFETLAQGMAHEIPFGQNSVSELQQRSIDFYQKLGPLVVKYRNFLLQEQVGYEGLIYCDCARNMDRYFSKLSYKHYVFAGFHVLSPSELEIVSYIKEHSDAQFYFDIDPFYCDFNKKDTFTTAFFIKKIWDKLKLPQDKIDFIQHDYAEIDKDIRIVGTSKSMNQIYYAIEALEEIKDRQGNLDDTALVLADESLLLPFLSAYDSSEANITMGVPVAATMPFVLLNSLLELYQNGSRYVNRNDSDKVIMLPHREVVAILRNPLIKKYFFDDSEVYNNTVNGLDVSQRAFFSKEDLPNSCLPDFNVLPECLLSSLIDYFSRFHELSKGTSQENALFSLLVDHLREAQVSLQPLLEMNEIISFSIVKYAIRQQLQGLSMPIQGDPAKGLQIMGLLETRTLDFKNVIMLSVNEGTLPSGVTYNSLLPFDYKYNDNTLPNYLYKDQVYAYHFFRLLQRAEYVVLLYDSDSNGKLSEKSRFIGQMEFEVKAMKMSNIHFYYPIVEVKPLLPSFQTIEIAKTSDIMAQLFQYNYSASALNNYINCPLQFYFQNICGISPENNFNDKIENSVIGKSVHAIFQSVFDAIKEKPDDYQNIIQNKIDHIDDEIKHSLLSIENFNLKEKDLQTGRLYLATQMIRNDVVNYLTEAKKEFAAGNIVLLGNELLLSCPFFVDDCHKVMLIGYVDRLQYQNGNLVILDYKTGKVYEDGLTIARDSFDDILMDPKHKQFLQLMVYSILLKNEDSVKYPDAPVCCGIVSIQEVNKHSDAYIHYAIVGDKNGRNWINRTDLFDNQQIEDFIKLLQTLLSEILNPDVPFTQAADKNRCSCCNFKPICQR